MAELFLLEAALREVEGLPLDAEAMHEVAQLRSRDERLRAMIRGCDRFSVADLAVA